MKKVSVEPFLEILASFDSENLSTALIELEPALLKFKQRVLLKKQVSSKEIELTEIIDRFLKLLPKLHISLQIHQNRLSKLRQNIISMAGTIYE